METEASRSLPSASEIINALNRTGFILEYRVAQTLRKLKFYVDINRAYEDPETGKSREMDVFAVWERNIERTPVSIHLDARLIIECKNNASPFVLIGERDQDYAFLDESVELSFDPLNFKFPRSSENPTYSAKWDLKLEHLPGSALKSDFTGYQLLRMSQHGSSWKADNTSIYDSILYPLAKAWQHEFYHGDEGYEDESEDDYSDWEYPKLTYYFPIVITAGPILTVDVTTGIPEVKEVGWARLKRNFGSKEMPRDFRVDVVSFDAFQDYLDSRVLKIVASAGGVLASNIHLFDPEWLLANLGEPEHKDDFNVWLDGIRSRRMSE